MGYFLDVASGSASLSHRHLSVNGVVMLMITMMRKLMNEMDRGWIEWVVDPAARECQVG